ncbi:MAG TPA: hypothetical protein VKU01_10770 [Bryobacteraceae bacterium]|nr:hypothetical protein [Bryobacteraceae bacterium]
MKTLRNGLVCLAFSASVCFAQTSSSGIDLISFAMPDAQVLGGAHVDAVKNSAFGQYVLARVQPTGVQIQNFVSQTGFNPLTDVTDVVGSTNGAKGADIRWLMAAHGSFTVGTIESNAQNHGATIASVTIAGFAADLVTITGKGQNACLVLFRDGATALVGDCTTVQSPTISAERSKLAAAAEALQNSKDVWFVSTLPLGQFAGAAPTNLPVNIQASPLLKSIQQVSGSVKFVNDPQNPSVQLAGEALTDSPDNARSLLNVFNFLVSMVNMSGNNNNAPEAASLLALIQGIDATVNGNAVDIALTIPENTLESIFSQHGPANLHAERKSDQSAPHAVQATGKLEVR